jgi:cell division protein FtsL
MADGSNNQNTNIQDGNTSSLSGLNARRANIPHTNLAQPVGFDRGIDNPLLAKRGVPVTSDDLRDSTERIINASTTNIIRDPDNKNVWNVEPDDFYSQADANDPNRRFDLGKFNKVFDVNREITKRNQRVDDLQKLNKLSSVDTKTSLYDLNISDILINTKNSWFNLLDDLLEQRFQIETFTKENRLFYVGLTVVLIAVILYVYTMLVSTDEEPVLHTTPPIQPVYIYQVPPMPVINGNGNGDTNGSPSENGNNK